MDVYKRLDRYKAELNKISIDQVTRQYIMVSIQQVMYV